MYCNNCGAELPDGAKFCVACGASVAPVEEHEDLGAPASNQYPAPQAEPVMANKAPKRRSGNTGRRLAFGAAAALALLVALFVGRGFLFPRGLAIDESTFPDEALRAQIAMAADLDGDGLLSAEELAALKQLRVTGARSVSGLDVFPALAELTVGGEELEEMVLSEMPALESLRVEDAPNLESTTIESCENLKTADFSGSDKPNVEFSEDTQPDEVIMPEQGTASGVDESVIHRFVPAENGGNNTRVASDGQWLYHLEYGKELLGTAHEGFTVIRTKLDGSSPQEICSMDTGLSDVNQFAVSNSRIIVRYTVSFSKGGIYTARTDGSDAQVIYPYWAGQFVVLDGRLYFGTNNWEESSASEGGSATIVDQIVSCKLDGSDLTVLAERNTQSDSPLPMTDVCAVSHGLLYCSCANNGLSSGGNNDDVAACIIDIGWDKEPGYVDDAFAWASDTYMFAAPGWTKPSGEEYVGFGGWRIPAGTLFGNTDRVFSATKLAGISEQTYGNPKSMTKKGLDSEVVMANASQRYAAIVTEGFILALRLSDDRLVQAVAAQDGSRFLGADIVDDTLYYFLEGEGDGLGQSVDLVALFEQADEFGGTGYYEDYLAIAEGLIAQHGEHSSSSSSSVTWATGLAYADLIDFDADGVEELLVVYRDATYASGSDGFDKEAYRIEVWGAGDNGAVLLGQFNPSFAGESIAFRVAKGELGAYVIEGDRGGKATPGVEYVTNYWGLEDGTFEIKHRLTFMDSSGAIVYTIDGAEVSESTYLSGVGDLGETTSVFYTLVGLGDVSYDDMFATTDETLQTLENN